MRSGTREWPAMLTQEDEAREDARIEAIKLSIFGKTPPWYKDGP